MLDINHFITTITDNQAVINFSSYGRASVLDVENRCSSVIGYQDHAITRNNETGQDTISIRVVHADINNIVDQAKVVLAG